MAVVRLVHGASEVHGLEYCYLCSIPETILLLLLLYYILYGLEYIFILAGLGYIYECRTHTHTLLLCPCGCPNVIREEMSLPWGGQVNVLKIKRAHELRKYIMMRTDK